MGISHFRRQHAPLEELLIAAQSRDSDDSAAMNEIVRRFDPLARRISRRLTSSWALREDIENAARLGLVHAVRRHDPSIPGFPAYAKQFMCGEARRECKRWSPPKSFDRVQIEVVSLNEADAFLGRGVITGDPPSDLNVWGDGATAQVIEELRSDQRELLRRRYIEDADLQKITKDTGTTVSAVSQRLGTIHRHLCKALAA